MKIKKSGLALFIITASAFAFTTTTHAQFGGISGLGKKKEASSVDADTFAKSTAAAAGEVLGARIKFLDAQAKLMEALGLKTDSVVKASEALRAKEGATSSSGDKVDALKDSSKVSAEANQQVDVAMASSQELSAEAKMKFAEGTGKFIEGVVLEKGQVDTLQRLTEQGKTLISSAGPLEKIKTAGLVKPVTNLTSMVAGDVKEGGSTLGKIMAFTRTQKIGDIPNAEKATDAIGDLK